MNRKYAMLSLLLSFFIFEFGVMSRALGQHQPASPPAIDLSQIKLLYASGQYVQVADSLAPYLRQNPSDYRARAVLVLALLKLDEKDLARTELNTLETNKTDPHAVDYAEQLGALLATTKQDKEKKQEIYSALLRYDAAGAS